ncbi:amidohydrolase 1 [Tanacetum coccineum]
MVGLNWGKIRSTTQTWSPKGRALRQVLPTVPHLLDSVQVEGTFPDGTKLITVHDPVSSENGNLDLALHGSFLPTKDGQQPAAWILEKGIEELILEFVHDGDKSVAELMDIGRQLLGRRQVLPTVPHLLDSVQVEGTFPDAKDGQQPAAWILEKGIEELVMAL